MFPVHGGAAELEIFPVHSLTCTIAKFLMALIIVFAVLEAGTRVALIWRTRLNNYPVMKVHRRKRRTQRVE
jgi:hypothetical protein